MRARGSIGLVAFAVALAALSGCSSEKSFAVVSVRAADREFTDVSQLVVDVQNGSTSDQLRYPKTPNASLKFSTTEMVDFSVSFKTDYTGPLRIGVTALGPGGTPVGYGETEKNIDPGHVIRMEVVIVRDALPPGPSRDGGTTGGGDGGVSGCDPTNATTCGAAKTCYVGCRMTTGTGVCTEAGTKKPGEICEENDDCEPGTQCFAYGCGAKVCMKFCKDNSVCGTGRCAIEVPCGGVSTGIRICSQSCDPRGPATSGCAAGLNCFIFPGENAMCDCRGDKRMGGDGTTCTDATDCQPGLLCVGMGGANKTCRPICKLADKDCSAGRTCTKLVDPNYETWGACLP